VTVDLFKQGRSVMEIAAVRGLAQSTIEGHLAEAMEAGEWLEVQRLVSEEKQRQIEEVLMELGPGPLKAAMERLGDGYSYAELRFIRAGQILQQRS
jgi:ATP-dependent DNA helicase RecQ